MLWSHSEVSLALKAPDQLNREAAHPPRTPMPSSHKWPLLQQAGGALPPCWKALWLFMGYQDPWNPHQGYIPWIPGGLREGH